MCGWYGYNYNVLCVMLNSLFVVVRYVKSANEILVDHLALSMFLYVESYIIM
jgi:hypothetical protein